MDIVEPLPRIKGGNEYILTIQDELSKFCLAIPLADQTAATIADRLCTSRYFRIPQGRTHGSRQKLH